MAETHTGELLEPIGPVLVLAGVAVLLVMAGAKLERWLMKRQLEVLDGAAAGGDVDLTREASGGGRA